MSAGVIQEPVKDMTDGVERLCRVYCLEKENRPIGGEGRIERKENLFLLQARRDLTERGRDEKKRETET